MALDKTWQVGIAWGLLLTIVTIAGVYVAGTSNSTMPLGLPFLFWIGFVAWLEKGVTK